MNLEKLIQPDSVLDISGPEGESESAEAVCNRVEILGLAVDSRKVKPGDMFFCLKGTEADGHAFAASAAEKGAAAILHMDEIEKAEGEGAPVYIKVDDTLSELNRICDVFYGSPSSELTVFGITGTNGKTTTASIISSIFSEHAPCGYMGTIAVRYGDYSRIPTLTTPDQIEVHEVLREMADHGMKACAMEVSSHGLAMKRVDTVDFDCAVFTNLSYDHLDYHKTMEEYFAAKSLLFSGMKPDGAAVINADDVDTADKLLDLATCRCVTYSREGRDADYRAEDIELSTSGTKFTLLVKSGANKAACAVDAGDARAGGPEGEKAAAGSAEGDAAGASYKIETNIVADYNISNLLAAMAAMHEMGMPIEDMLEPLKSVPQVDGRMEVIDEGQDFSVIVDYAHTPDGYDKIFAFAGNLMGAGSGAGNGASSGASTDGGAGAAGRGGDIYAVFGSAGKRDKVKRKVLGQIAGRHCRKIIVTEEDPRTESAAEISEEILSGVLESGCEGEIILDREEAIEACIRLAKPGDLVLILGKGDESYMYYGDGRAPWIGDNQAAINALHKLK